VDRIEAFGLAAGHLDPLLRDDTQTGFLEAGADLADEVAARGVRLDDRQRAFNAHLGFP
jgi:hypothetical protein